MVLTQFPFGKGTLKRQSRFFNLPLALFAWAQGSIHRGRAVQCRWGAFGPQAIQNVGDTDPSRRPYHCRIHPFEPNTAISAFCCLLGGLRLVWGVGVVEELGTACHGLECRICKEAVFAGRRSGRVLLVGATQVQLMKGHWHDHGFLLAQGKAVSQAVR